MTRKTRRFIFYIFLILFIFFASAILLYAQGYSFDLKKKALVMTGAFYFESYPKEADIYINNQYQGKTNKFVKRLLPDEYDIKISKPNYWNWQKTLKVESRLVTEAKNILLIKKELQFNLTTDNKVKYLSLSPDKKKFIYLTDKVLREIDPKKQQIADPREIPTYSGLAFRLMDPVNNTDNQIYPVALSKGAGYALSLPDLNNFLDISWSYDNEKILLSFLNDHYYILDLKNPLKIIDINNLIKTLSNYKIYNIKNILFHPQDSNKIYFYSQNNLYFIEINFSNSSKSLLSPPVISNILTYTIYDNKILYINNDGGFYRTNPEVSSFKKYFDIPILKPEQPLRIINDELLLIGSDLYLLRSQTQVFEKIAENIDEISFSIDEKKMLWKTKNEIGIIWLESEFGQPRQNKYETETIMKTAKNINRAIWYSKTNQHIILTIDNEVKITELDDRDRRITMDILTVKNPQVFYNEGNEKLYILSEEKLYWINPID